MPSSPPSIDLRSWVRDIPDFPKPGIIFKDITPVLARPQLVRAITDTFVEHFKGEGITAVVGMESRGFLFGVPLALALDCAFVPARKPGKLPYHSIGFEYALEYGTNRLELHTDAVHSGDTVLIIDDLLATGGTANATVKLVEQLGARVAGCGFVIELSFLNGREVLGDIRTEAIVVY